MNRKQRWPGEVMAMRRAEVQPAKNGRERTNETDEMSETNETNVELNWTGTRLYCLLKWKVPQIDNIDGSWHCK